MALAATAAAEAGEEEAPVEQIRASLEAALRYRA